MRPRLLSSLLLVITATFVAGGAAWAEIADRITPGPIAISDSRPTNAISWLLPSDPGFLEWWLDRCGLRPLSAEPLAPGEERVRFLWQRSFHRAALFELRFASDGTGVYEAKLWEKTPAGGRWVVQRKVTLGVEARDLHRRSLERLGFFALPFDDGRQGLDGATWLFEAREGSLANAVHRWSPAPGPLRGFGESLIEMAIPSEFLPIY